MIPKKSDTHALFLKWGRFEAGAYGLPAVALLTLLLGATLLWIVLR